MRRLYRLYNRQQANKQGWCHSLLHATPLSLITTTDVQAGLLLAGADAATTHHDVTVLTLLPLHAISVVASSFMRTCQAAVCSLIVHQFGPMPCLVPPKLLKNVLCKKKISRHIKLAIYAWSTKCR
jgi:hypothetical protein